MSPEQRLRKAIDLELIGLRRSITADRSAAIAALHNARDQLPRSTESDLITGRQFTHLGTSKALQLVLESATASANPSSVNDLTSWSDQFIRECGHVAEMELVLAHIESGFMRCAEIGDGIFHAWIASKRIPASWRERNDIDSWELQIARELEPERLSLEAERAKFWSGELADNGYFDRHAAFHVRRMSYQLGYPQDAVVSGCPIRTVLHVLQLLISWALEEESRGETPAPRFENALIESISIALNADSESVARVIAAFTLTRESAAYHAEVPGIAAAPLVRLDSNRLIWSIHGLLTEPLLFLTRELRRRSAQEYHNAAFLREAVFRDDLYSIFRDKRFVVSANRIELRRVDGDLRTDVDAAVFDRKTGTLGLFELKSQDPFSRSAGELTRRRDNLMHANRQVAGVLDWLKRYGADDLLGRIDSATAKKFRAQKVFPFVIGRYLVRFDDGPEPDRRAAWGTWPQLLRFLNGFAVNASESNPIASLHARLLKDAGFTQPPIELPSRQITIGATTLVVHPSHAAYLALVE